MVLFVRYMTSNVMIKVYYSGRPVDTYLNGWYLEVEG